LAGGFIEAKNTGGGDAFGDGFRGAEREAVIRAKVGDQRAIEQVIRGEVALLELLRSEAVADAELVFELPEVVVLGGGVEAPVGGAGGVLVVDLDAAVEWEAILDPKRKRTGAGFGARSEDGKDLAVAVLVGAVEFALEDPAVEQFVGLQAGQGANNVVAAEVAIAGDANNRPP